MLRALICAHERGCLSDAVAGGPTQLLLRQRASGSGFCNTRIQLMSSPLVAR
jgi:hypothetical protein